MSIKEAYRLAVGSSISALLLGFTIGKIPKDPPGEVLIWLMIISVFFPTIYALLIVKKLRRLTPTSVLGGAIGGILLGYLFGFLFALGGFLLALVLVGAWEARRGVHS